MKGGSVAIVVLARVPVAGQAKTRLAPGLGAYRAARLHARLVARTVRMAAATGARIELHLDSARRAAELVPMCRRYRLERRRQRGADLGERMQRSIQAALRSCSIVVLIGTDCPALSARHIARAIAALAGGRDAAFAPAEDGGYGLVALRRCAPSLFAGIAWGGERVYAETLVRVAALGWRARDVGRVWDVDRPADLERYRAAPWRFEKLHRTNKSRAPKTRVRHS